ncbi:hypothetical protein KC19_10G140400 [Ceratodon purpureus]|uniref:Uncharacterized protein n=1 Tax=Ceratodon purpureus TaxID=3225 RepID=A0A8T0GKB2_CERPU|nr:hypothetical protein KC19_10G140400 [Ceratodon purpureus]
MRRICCKNSRTLSRHQCRWPPSGAPEILYPQMARNSTLRNSFALGF